MHSFQYLIYIRENPERVWDALTSAADTNAYWFGRRIQSTWNEGDPVEFRLEDDSLDVTGEVLHCSRPLSLSYTWRIHKHPQIPESTVSFEFTKIASDTRVTLVHSGFSEPVDQNLVVGWSRILSSLKSYLESGTALSVTTDLRDCSAG